MRLISVAVPVPRLDALTYNVPHRFPDLPPVGARVRVPVGTRTLVGCVIGHDPTAGPDTETRDVKEVLDHEPFLPAAIVELCKWVAEYYMAGIGDAIGVALPPTSRRVSGYKTRRIVAATPHLGSDPGSRGLTPQQREALGMLAAAPAGLPASVLRDRGVGADVLRRLAVRGLVAMRAERDERDPFGRAALADVVRDTDRALTGEQDAALATLSRLAETGTFQVALLHGVTGSGKTEVYLRLAEQVCRLGRQVLLLVPEIALTPSVAALLRSAFGERVAIQHSALSGGERHDQWQRIRRGDVDVVVGTRSAVFAPLARTGLIIVDEEQDSSYKQDETPRYHGRDVAIVRARAEGALVVLGSATPSLESYQNAAAGKYTRVTLERRVLDRSLAGVRLVNMREEYAEQGPEVIVSRALVAAIRDRLSRREQVVVLLNRRGYSTAVFCRQCGDTFECPNCSVSLTVHRASGLSRGAPPLGRARHDAERVEESRRWKARCHYCNYSNDVPRACRKCAAPYLEQAGVGTAKVEQHLIELFPEARVRRVDRDSVRRRGALTTVLSKFAAGEVDILVGTQMIAKGHDFPRVTLVGVISADIGLGLADFRAAERTFQLLTQVAGRAGRGERAGEAIVQTLYPEHYSIQVACRQDYATFFERELAYRRSMRYPPVVALINAVVRGRTFADAAGAAATLVRELDAPARDVPFIVLGPAPAPLGRLRGEHRVQFFLKGTRRAAMRCALRDALAAHPRLERRVTIDVDPLNVL
ncbi:MAG: primosomal protein N' [Acidobacteria bacterium RIFCSPLOWO2_12_FULL_68_19]|nr:MAG: primosomal protein N' [Acidobacteria bacterium RIFCSPLOWO2_12_FULL_68_19]